VDLKRIDGVVMSRPFSLMRVADKQRGSAKREADLEGEVQAVLENDAMEDVSLRKRGDGRVVSRGLVEIVQDRVQVPIGVVREQEGVELRRK